MVYIIAVVYEIHGWNFQQLGMGIHSPLSYAKKENPETQKDIIQIQR